MAAVYDNWERLVHAILDREELRRLALCPSLSSCSTSADFSSHFSVDQLCLEDPHAHVPYFGRIADRERPPAAVRTFTFHELAVATRNFGADCLMDEGGFGRLYKGHLQGSNHVVAIKQLGHKGRQGNTEFLVERLMLSLFHHPNLINLVGHCDDEDHRLLVYEYLPLGSLYNLLHEHMPGRKHLDWNTRMKIAAGVAKGVEYLHHKAHPPVIHRDLNPSNIFLGEGYHPKICNLGLAELRPVGDKTHVSTKFMATCGYCAPEYAMTGRRNKKADVYSFGVVLLEIISGRKAVRILETGEPENIVEWATPLFRNRGKFKQIADPALQGQYRVRSLYGAIVVAAMCVREQADLRPTMADVAMALTYLCSQKYKPELHQPS